ncbi:MAG: hypothetical protein HOV80_32030 [Polyangiaceae bacterium]|nr:hypothetical protein [Polyangiaceae bacterium]
MRSTFLRTLGVAVVAAGCSEVLVTPDDGTGGNSNEGASGPTASTTIATSTSSFGTQSSVTTGGEGGAPEVLCPLVLDRGFYLTMTVNGSFYALNMPCGGDEAYNAPTAAFGGGGECAHGTLIRACAVPEPDQPSGIVFSTPLAGPGTAPAEGIFGDMPFEDVEVTITSYGEVNGIIRGGLNGILRLPDDTEVEATGEFIVCRIPDTPPCP